MYNRKSLILFMGQSQSLEQLKYSLLSHKDFKYNPNNDKKQMEIYKKQIQVEYPKISKLLDSDGILNKKNLRFVFDVSVDDDDIIVTNYYNPFDYEIIYSAYLHPQMFTLVNRQKCCKTEECSICLDKLSTKKDNSYIPIKLKCGHMFHYNCLSEWYSTNQSCPICRQEINIFKDKTYIKV